MDRDGAENVMLIRPEKPLVVGKGSHPADAWELVNRTQRSDASSGWLIPQPAHSALAAEIAAKLSPEHFPGLTDKVLRSIALHDAGWSSFDADQIEKSREPKFRPVSFVAEKPAVFLPAWTESIITVEKICAEGGYMVSRHFDSLSKQASADYSASEQKQIAQFQMHETQRQQRLAQLSGKPERELEALWHANRFCDLLSLFLCCNIELQNGSGAEVRFPGSGTQHESYLLGWSGEDFVFAGDTPFRERVELTFSGVSFGGGKRAGGWFNAAVR